MKVLSVRHIFLLILLAAACYHIYTVEKTLPYAQDIILMFILAYAVAIILIRKIKSFIFRSIVTAIAMAIIYDKYELQWSTHAFIIIVLMF